MAVNWETSCAEYLIDEAARLGAGQQLLAKAACACARAVQRLVKARRRDLAEMLLTFAGRTARGENPEALPSGLVSFDAWGDSAVMAAVYAAESAVAKSTESVALFAGKSARFAMEAARLASWTLSEEEKVAARQAEKNLGRAVRSVLTRDVWQQLQQKV